MNVDPTDPFTLVAQEFMERKGYKDVFPAEVEPLEGDPDCQYFYYELDDGDLELEVSWNPKSGTWDTLVTAFKLLN